MMILPEFLDNFPCVLVPQVQEHPFLNFTILPSCPQFVIGYAPAYAPTTMTATSGSPLPPTQPLTITTAQPPPPPPPCQAALAGAHHQAFRPGLPVLTTHNGHVRPQFTAGPTYHTNNTSTTIITRPTFHAKRGGAPIYRGGFNKVFRASGFKRKVEEIESGEKEGSEKSGDPLIDLTKPLFCKLCKVVLNAQAQAKQHYEGKTHLRKVKMFMDGNEEETATQDSQVSSTVNRSPGSPTSPASTTGPSPASPTTSSGDAIDPEIYCKTCGVSFNSTKQAQQHYQGKNHAKRVRATNHPDGGGGGGNKTTPSSTSVSAAHTPFNFRKGSKLGCEICNLNTITKEQLSAHFASPKHAAQLVLFEKASKSLKGRWTTNPAKFTGGSTQTLFRSNNHFNQHNQGIGVGPSPPKKTRNDFSNYRLPSGKFYCSMCNMTMGSEVGMVKHIDSRQHRGAIALQKTEEMAELAMNS